jgi:hypothetical protein
MQLRINKQLFLVIIASVFTLLFLLVVIISFFFKPNSRTPQSTLTPTPVGLIITPTLNPELKNNPTTVETGPGYTKSLEIIDKKNQSFLSHEYLVGQLIRKLPYTGKNVSMAYDISNNEFLIAFDKTNRLSGEQELTAFLKSNKIEDQSWIRNLIINYQ